HRDVRPDAVDHERKQQEDEPATQVAELAGLGEPLLPGHRVGCHVRSAFRPGLQATLPPAASMAALAPAVAPMPVSLTAFVSSPDLMTFTTLASWPTRPACLRASTSTSAAPSLSSWASVTSALNFSEADLKPRLGRRRCSGIWPPSKPTLWKPPARDFWPLWPRPAVLPRPEPMP